MVSNSDQLNYRIQERILSETRQELAEVKKELASVNTDLGIALHEVSVYKQTELMLSVELQQSADENIEKTDMIALLQTRIRNLNEELSTAYHGRSIKKTDELDRQIDKIFEPGIVNEWKDVN